MFHPATVNKCRQPIQYTSTVAPALDLRANIHSMARSLPSPPQTPAFFPLHALAVIKTPPVSTRIKNNKHPPSAIPTSYRTEVSVPPMEWLGVQMPVRCRCSLLFAIATRNTYIHTYIESAVSLALRPVALESFSLTSATHCNFRSTRDSNTDRLAPSLPRLPDSRDCDSMLLTFLTPLSPWVRLAFLSTHRIKNKLSTCWTYICISISPPGFVW